MVNVLVFGGGNGLPRMLRGLKNNPSLYLQGAVTMADNGGSAGRFRIIDDAPPFADLTRSLVPLSDRRPVTRHFERTVRWEGESHRVRNIMSSRIFNANDRDMESTVRALHTWLRVSGGEIIPSTHGNTHLHARLENGQVIVGETNIDIPKHDGTKRIRDVWLEPYVEASPALLQAINTADMLVFGCGDWFTSLIASIRPGGVAEAIRDSKAVKVLVLNLMTKYGETYGYGIGDFVHSLEQYIGADVIDRILVNSTVPSAHAHARYRDERAQWIWVDPNGCYANRLVLAPLITDENVLVHDARLVGEAMKRIISSHFPAERQLLRA